jgi:hypothetical protein
MPTLKLLPLLTLLALSSPTHAAITAVNVGASANDMTGDVIRRAFQIINTNFSNLDAQFGTVTNLLTVPTMAALRAMPATNSTTGYQLVGYLTANDGGGGRFYVDPLGIEDDNAGTIITPNNNVGRIRRLEDNSDVYPQWFGGVINNATINAAISYVSTRGHGTVWITADTAIDPINDPITMRSNVALLGAPGGGLHFEGLQPASWTLITVPEGTTNGAIWNLKLRGRLETPGSTNNTGYLIDLGAVTNFSIGGIQARDWYTGYLSPLDGKAFSNLQIFDENGQDTVLGYGAVRDGFTDDTVAFQQAVHHKQQFNGKVFVPRGPSPYFVCSIWVTNGSVSLISDGATLEQHYHNPEEGVVPRISSVFTICAHNTVVEGFTFRQAGLYPTTETDNVTGFCSPVNIHLATNVVVRNNLFDTGTGKGISCSGSYPQFINNSFVKSGITFGVGQRLDWLFYEDASITPGDLSTYNKELIYRSPLSPLVQGNTFIGSNPNKICVLFSAAPGFKFLDNVMIDMDTPTGSVVIYSGDAGFTDLNGTNIYNMPGLVRGNTITGSFGDNGAINLRINTPTSDYVQAGFIVTNMTSSVVIEQNDIRGTGHGIEINSAPGTIVRNNYVKVTGSPLWPGGNCTGLVFDGGYYESTTAGLGATIPASETYLRPPIMKNMIFRNLTLVSSAGDEYAMRNVEPIFYENLTVDNVTFDFRGAAGSGDPPKVLQFSASKGFIKVVDSTFIITNSMSKRPIAFISGTAAVDFSRNITIAPDGVYPRGASLAGRKVRIEDNNVGGFEITGTTLLQMSGNQIESYPDSQSPLVVSTTGRAMIVNNYITNNSTTATICADIGVTNGTFSDNIVMGNSSSDMVRSTLGRLLTFNNVILNAGAGFNYPTAHLTGTVDDTAGDRALHVDMGAQTGYTFTLHRDGSPGWFGIHQDNYFGASSDRDAQYHVWPLEAAYHAGHAFFVHTAGDPTNTLTYGFGMNGSKQFLVNGSIETLVAGQGVRIKEGSNARMGQSTLVTGTVTIANTSITASTRIFVFPAAAGTLNGRIRVASRVNSTSFTVTSSDAGDTAAFDWLLVEPTP